MLAGGPTVNRALLASLYPPGIRVKNNGTVTLDNPDRVIPHTDQITAGYERQLWTTLSVSADYVHARARDQFMLQDLNPGLRTSTSRTATLVRINPAYAGAGESADQRRLDRLRRARDGAGQAFRLRLLVPRVVHAGLLAREHDRRRHPVERLPGARRSEPRPERGTDQRRSPAQPGDQRPGTRAEDVRAHGCVGRARAERVDVHAASTRPPIPIGTARSPSRCPLAATSARAGTRGTSTSMAGATAPRDRASFRPICGSATGCARGRSAVSICSWTCSTSPTAPTSRTRPAIAARPTS